MSMSDYREDWETEEPEVTEEETGKEKKKRVVREILSFVRLIIIVIGVMFFLQTFVIINARIPSESMETTIMTGDHIFGNRLIYHFRDPKRSDIVIFRYPDNERQLYIKRIIGLPGEVLEIRDGKVYVDGSEEPLEDSFCSFDPNDAIPGTNPGKDSPGTEGGTRYVVPEDSYFMLGDNRDHSKDSRFWDQPYVLKKKIVGKAFLRYWPFSRFSVIKHDQGYAQPSDAGGEG